MGFYNLTKEERVKLTAQISKNIFSDFLNNSTTHIAKYFSDADTYIRKAAYIAVGRIYFGNKNLQRKILSTLEKLFSEDEFKIRQSVINAAGEIGTHQFDVVELFFDKGLFDEHHSVRNAVIGSVKKMSEKNPKPVLIFAKRYLHHPDKEIRREICHGIELRGRTHPQDILPLLKELQNDKTARVCNTLIHVIGQISYKKGCLATVIAELNSWENKKLTEEAVEEIIDVHYRYRNFSVLSQQEAKVFIQDNFDRF